MPTGLVIILAGVGFSMLFVLGFVLVAVIRVFSRRPNVPWASSGFDLVGNGSEGRDSEGSTSYDHAQYDSGASDHGSSGSHSSWWGGGSDSGSDSGSDGGSDAGSDGGSD